MIRQPDECLCFGGRCLRLFCHQRKNKNKNASLPVLKSPPCRSDPKRVYMKACDATDKDVG